MTTEHQSPTVILVHGAFADASSWARVLERVRDTGIAAEAIPNPLRGLTFDGEYVASVLGQIEGPIVLVGHSYGGAVMTYAGSKAPSVRALVCVASFGLDEGVSANRSVADYAPPEARDLGAPRPKALTQRLPGGLTGAECRRRRDQRRTRAAPAGPLVTGDTPRVAVRFASSVEAGRGGVPPRPVERWDSPNDGTGVARNWSAPWTTCPRRAR
jgi:pimeloyl-ACP methyl ester carboxylesterase